VHWNSYPKSTLSALYFAYPQHHLQMSFTQSNDLSPSFINMISQIKCYVINLDRSKDQLEYITQILGLKF